MSTMSTAEIILLALLILTNVGWLAVAFAQYKSVQLYARRAGVHKAEVGFLLRHASAGEKRTIMRCRPDWID